MTAPPWLIVADDRTGAADCAIPFARRGARALVAWGPLIADSADVVSIDAETRGLPAAEAARRHRDVLARLSRRPPRVFKKIDSTLRGQPAAEIAAMLSVLGPRAVLAPAFPAQRRTTTGGRVHLDGAPLETTGLWQREASYASADLAEILASAGVGTRKAPLDLVRGDAGRLAAFLRGGGVVICDAVEDADLDRIVAAGLSLEESRLWIGSAGLAHALARAEWHGAPVPLPVAAHAGGILVAAGSPAAATEAAIACLSALGGVRTVAVGPATIADAPSKDWAAAAAALAAGLAEGDVVLHLSGEPFRADRAAAIADGLGRLVATAADSIGGLVATGGETAAAVLRHLGVAGIRLADEVEPGVPLGLTVGGVAIPLVTKAGAFGDSGALKRALVRLRQARLKGTTA